MARMHTRKKGRAGSQKPARKTTPPWVEADAKEVESAVLSLSKEGRTESTIGRHLRDTRGVPSVRSVTGKTISKILKDGGQAPQFPTDLIELIRKAVRLRRHVKANGQDRINKTALIRVESKIKRLVKYYRGRKLPKDWKYDPEEAALLVK